MPSTRSPAAATARRCQCQWWTLTNAEFQQTSRDEREDLLHDEIAAGPPPALIAYVDGEAAGWIRVGPRTRQVRLARTRDFTAYTEEPWDDDSVWAVSCFVVRREHRGKGLNARLLDAAVDFARAQRRARHRGAIRSTRRRGRQEAPSNELFRGVVSTFENAGFREVARPKPDRAIVALDLDGLSADTRSGRRVDVRR